MTFAPGDPRAVLAEGAVMLAARADGGSESAMRDLVVILGRLGALAVPGAHVAADGRVIGSDGLDRVERIAARRAAEHDRRAEAGLPPWRPGLP
jgi:hypothetical protein